MSKNKLAIFLLLLLASALVFIKAKIVTGRTHTIQFNPTPCFSCYGCGCTYIVDEVDSYSLDSSTKTECIYGLDKGTAGKYHDIIATLLKSGNNDAATVTLEGSDYKFFHNCVLKSSKPNGT